MRRDCTFHQCSPVDTEQLESPVDTDLTGRYIGRYIGGYIGGERPRTIASRSAPRTAVLRSLFQTEWSMIHLYVAHMPRL